MLMRSRVARRKSRNGARGGALPRSGGLRALLKRARAPEATSGRAPGSLRTRGLDALGRGARDRDPLRLAARLLREAGGADRGAERGAGGDGGGDRVSQPRARAALRAGEDRARTPRRDWACDTRRRTRSCGSVMGRPARGIVGATISWREAGLLSATGRQQRDTARAPEDRSRRGPRGLGRRDRCGSLRYSWFARSGLVEYAESQHIVRVKLAADRGTIYDRNMVPLTDNLTVQSVCAYPEEIESPSSVARQLVRTLGGSYDDYLTRLRKDKSFVWIRRQVTPSSATALRALDLPGIGFLTESKRVYLLGETACHVVGMTDIDGIGLSGIEMEMDEAPDRRRGDGLLLPRQRRSQDTDAGVHEGRPERRHVGGSDDRRRIFRASSRSSSSAASASTRRRAASRSVQDPWTGEILAMANWPELRSRSARALLDGEQEEPRDHGPVRAGFDVQARHGRRGPFHRQRRPGLGLLRVPGFEGLRPVHASTTSTSTGGSTSSTRSRSRATSASPRWPTG